MLNWHPVVERENRAIVRKSQIEQLRNESAQIESETGQLRNEKARLAELNAWIAAILCSSGTNVIPPPATPGPSQA